MLVVIREEDCIGCTKCIQACPVDAILGSANQMHTVIADECIGCELCLPPCPVDCIDLVQNSIPSKNKELTLKRSRARKQRLTSHSAQEDSNNEKNRQNNINATLSRIKALQSKSK